VRWCVCGGACACEVVHVRWRVCVWSFPPYLSSPGAIADEAFVSAQSEEKAKLTEFYQQQAAQAYPVQGSFHPPHSVLAQRHQSVCASAPDFKR
jgi:hypothetical protein